MTENARMLQGMRSDLYEAYEEGTLYDYLQDMLDVTYHIGASGDYLGAEIMLVYGGPGIYLDTRRRSLDLYWGGEESHISVASEVCDEIDEIMQEYYEMTR